MASKRLKNLSEIDFVLGLVAEELDRIQEMGAHFREIDRDVLSVVRHTPPGPTGGDTMTTLPQKLFHALQSNGHETFQVGSLAGAVEALEKARGSLADLSAASRQQIETDRQLKVHDLWFSIAKRVGTTIAVMTTVLGMMWIAAVTGAYVPAWMHPERIDVPAEISEVTKG